MIFVVFAVAVFAVVLSAAVPVAVVAVDFCLGV